MDGARNGRSKNRDISAIFHFVYNKHVVRKVQMRVNASVLVSKALILSVHARPTI